MAVTSTSPGPRAGGQLLLDDLPEDHGDAALHGLEGLTGEPLVRFAQTPTEGDHQTRGDPGVFAHQTAHIGPEHPDYVRHLGRLHRGRPALVLEHRELAEDVTRAERRERDRASIRVRADRTGLAGTDHVAGVRCIPLAEDRLPGPELPGHGHLGDPFEVAQLQVRERRHPGEQLDDIG